MFKKKIADMLDPPTYVHALCPRYMLVENISSVSIVRLSVCVGTPCTQRGSQIVFQTRYSNSRCIVDYLERADPCSGTAGSAQECTEEEKARDERYYKAQIREHEVQLQ